MVCYVADVSEAIRSASILKNRHKVSPHQRFPDTTRCDAPAMSIACPISKFRANSRLRREGTYEAADLRSSDYADAPSAHRRRCISVHWGSTDLL